MTYIMSNWSSAIPHPQGTTHYLVTLANVFLAYRLLSRSLSAERLQVVWACSQICKTTERKCMLTARCSHILVGVSRAWYIICHFLSLYEVITPHSMAVYNHLTGLRGQGRTTTLPTWQSR